MARGEILIYVEERNFDFDAGRDAGGSDRDGTDKASADGAGWTEGAAGYIVGVTCDGGQTAQG